jgi:DNA primase
MERATPNETGSIVPGVDFNVLRAEITMEQVLTLLGFQPSARSGVQCYGACPLHESVSRRSRCFSVNLATGRYYCHRCHSHGNQLDLWAAATKLPLHQATIDLCHRLGREVSWIRRW